MADEIETLRALVREFVDATDWKDQKNENLMLARSWAAEIVPGVKGNPNFTAEVAAARATRQGKE